jgi:hypothetical protein
MKINKPWAGLLWGLYTAAFFIILLAAPDPYMMLGLLIGVFIGIDLEILDNLSRR